MIPSAPAMKSGRRPETSLSQNLTSIATTNGQLMTVYLGPHPTVIISDPAYNRKILANAPFLSRRQLDIRLRVFSLGFTSLATSLTTLQSAVAKVGPALEEEVDALISRWTKNGNGTVELRRNFKLLTANGILATVYDVRCSEITDPEHEKVYFNHIDISCLAGISKATDVITRYIPWSEVSQLQVIKAILEDGKPAPDYTSVETILRMPRDIVGGAFNTSSASLEWLLAFVRKLHEKLDRVVGCDQALTYEDQGKLIYLKAIIWKTLRMRPSAPLEVEVNGVKYLIPKGTMIMSNIPALHKQMHPNSPDEFCPERHIDNISASKSNWSFLQLKGNGVSLAEEDGLIVLNAKFRF
ncbi:cytochrome P450 [Cladochytrium replicatum]|nr:cytochrome P450 [Cladochytrium replicatum]